MRRIFSTVRRPHEPAFTVESFAMIATVRPAMLAVPVTTPSAGSSGSTAFASSASSTNEPGSMSRAMRSRAKSFPFSAFFAWYLGAPPFSMRASVSVSFLSRDMSALLLRSEKTRHQRGRRAYRRRRRLGGYSRVGVRVDVGRRVRLAGGAARGGAAAGLLAKRGGPADGAGVHGPLRRLGGEDDRRAPPPVPPRP